MVERGGLDKFIWFAPIEQAAIVLRELYQQRDQCKQTIYELTGISDIIRGATDANETAAAQGLKSQWGSLRLRRLQNDVQRYIRDLISLMAEVIGEKFQQSTLQQMTMLPYITEQQWQMQLAQMQQQAQMQAQQYQQAAMQAQQQGQQPPPPPQPPQMPQKPITWEVICEALKNDAQRTYKVDIETDSTIAVELQQDMQALSQVLTALGETTQGLMQSVQAGFMPFGAAKEILLTICRHAKLGNAVEDEIDKMEAPPPPPNPDASKAQAQMQIEQGKMQMQMQLEQGKAQLADQQHQRELAADQQHAQMLAQIEMQAEQSKQQLQAQQIQAQNQMEAQRVQIEHQAEMQIEAMRQQMEERLAQQQQQVDLLISHMDNQAKVQVAEIAANTTITTAQIGAANQAESEDE